MNLVHFHCVSHLHLVITAADIIMAFAFINVAVLKLLIEVRFKESIENIFIDYSHLHWHY